VEVYQLKIHGRNHIIQDSAGLRDCGIAVSAVSAVSAVNIEDAIQKNKQTAKYF